MGHGPTTEASGQAKPNPYQIERLGKASVLSPIHLGSEPGDLLADFTPEEARVLLDIELEKVLEHWRETSLPPSLEKAGPRQSIYFDPSKLKVGIVTCGGLCPGLNNVIRGLVMNLYYAYGVRSIFGFRYGFAGLNPIEKHPVIELTPEFVRDIHLDGGTVLGTSRGPQDPQVMVDMLEQLNIRLLFTIGGDGTFRGAQALHKEIQQRNLKIAVIGIPKTIDNDIPLVDKTFGFDTAVGLATEAIQAAYFESRSVERGVGLVKLMGRNSGFIAANAALASRNVNLVLIPELPFELEGAAGLFAYLQNRFRINKTTVIVVAEGAGQEHLQKSRQKDRSGNIKFADIGLFLQQQISHHFAGKIPFSLKYIDPSYMIRSAPAASNDSVFCGYLAQSAAHAGMSGRTGMAVGRSHGQFTHIPLSLLVGNQKKIDPESPLWLSVLESTGQPFYLLSQPPKNLARKSFTLKTNGT